MSDNIALKIQTEIMKRLPVISLIRFRSVSKQWTSVIDSPEFIADHCVIQHHTQSQHHRHLLLSCMESGVSSWGTYVVRYFSIVDDDTFPHQKVLMTTPESVSVNQLHGPSSIVAVSGGLFCISGSNNAVIWNPSIKKTVTIVVPNVTNLPADIDLDDVPYETIVGFGVCPRTSDPKLVKITFNVWYHKEYATIPNQVEVFSLSSGLWKPLISSKLPRKSMKYMYPQVAINEFIYWLVYDMSSLDWKEQCCRLIMSFDLTSEEFTEVYLSDILASCKTDVYISKLNESLVVLEKDHASNANVWIMQNGDPKSFTHIFTINTPIISIRDVAGFRKNGEPILVKKKALKERELIVYEPNSKQINYTGIAGAFIYFFASPYTQTLLLHDHKDSVDTETVNAICKQDRKPLLALRSSARLRSRRPPAQSTVTNNLQAPSGSYTTSRLPKPSFEVDEAELTISDELRELRKMLQGTLRGSANTSQSDAGNPLFERDRGVYEDYSARRNERLKRKRGESGVEKQTPSKQYLGVRMESAKRTVEVKKYESARKMTTPLVERREVATAQRVERREPVTTQRYSLRSSSKVNKKPPLVMSFERSIDAATVERKTTVRRTARKGY